jgi:outer membrane PBP1 activator LpoA protein
MTLYTYSKIALATFFISTALLTGCNSTPSKDNSIKSEAQELRDHAPLIESARRSDSPLKEQYLLTAAEILANKGDRVWARNLLASIDSEQLIDSNFYQYTELYSSLALLDDAYFLAQRILTEPRLEQQWKQLTIVQAIALRERRAQVFIILGEIDQSLNERLLLELLLTDETLRNTNHNAIWQALMTLPQAVLQERAKQEQNSELKAWYQLANLNKNNQGDLGLQQRQIQQWMQNWPQHPASLKLPSDLQLIGALIEQTPRAVALLLPLSDKLGKAGSAIRDGFFSAYYQAMHHGSWIPAVRIYDTSNAKENIEALYLQAISDGAEMVIGPLNKGAAKTLSELTELPAPILSLNYIEKKASTELPSTSLDALMADPFPNSEPLTATILQPNFYQFGLAIEDETAQAANRAWLEGHRRAMIITPNASWGERSADAFARQWQTLGGEVVSINRFTGKNDYSAVIASALHIDQSKRRASELQGLFGHSFEFEPRRRQDLDMVFLTARPGQARQIIPTLAFHYAGKVPVYATSHVYAGTADRKNDRDLNGIKFSSSPWIFDQTSPEKKAIDAHRPSSASYGRLYALGVDAYHIYPRLMQLQQVPGTRFFGATGALTMKQNQRIERQQTWAQIISGRAIPMPVVVPSNP